MHPFAQHVKHYAATLITHPMSINEPSHKIAAGRIATTEARRRQVLQFIGANEQTTAPVAHSIGIGAESMLQFLQKMASDGILSMRRGPQNKWLFRSIA